MSDVSETGGSGLIVRCEGCDKAYKIYPERLPSGISSFPCRACGTLVPISGEQVDKTLTDEGGKILIVVEEEQLGKLIKRILDNSGFKSNLVNSGKEALQALQSETWDLFLLSVYLPDMMGYELLDKLSGGPEGTAVPSILLSSIHHAARYKRAPTSLYGADDYLERHHLPDLLVPKIRRLLSAEDSAPPEVTPPDLPPPTDEQVLARRDLEVMENTTQPPEDPRMGEVQRMCRVIAGDIALYNEDVIASTTPENLFDAIAADLREGEALLTSKFPEMDEQLAHLLKGEMLRLLNSRGIQVP